MRSQTLIESIKQEIKQQLNKPAAKNFANSAEAKRGAVNESDQQLVEQEHSLRVISLLEQLEGELLNSLIGMPKKSD